MERADFWKTPGLNLFKGTERIGTIVNLWWYESGSGRRWVKINKDNEFSNIENGDNISICDSGRVIATLANCLVKQLELNTIDLVCDIIY